MGERSIGSEYDREKVAGHGEARRQQNEQTNQAGGQQGSSGMGDGPRGAERDGRVGAMSRENQQAQGEHPGPGEEGLADQLNHGRAQGDPAKTTGTSNRPASPNGSGSMGSTRRDDPPRAPRR